MNSFPGIPRCLYEQPWSSWCAIKELESEEDTSAAENVQPAADVMRLPTEYMSLFGFCPKQNDFYLVICELCGMGIKPMGMTHHMSLRHSKDKEVKSSTPIKTLNKENDAKPRNRKHDSSANVLHYGQGVGALQKILTSGIPSVNLSETEHIQDTAQIRPSDNAKLRKSDTFNKLNSSPEVHSKQCYSKGNTLFNDLHSKIPLVKSFRGSKQGNADGAKPSETAHKFNPVTPGLRLQLVGFNNPIVFKRNSRSVLYAASEFEVHHRRHTSHKLKPKIIPKQYYPVLLKKSSSVIPVIPSLPMVPPPNTLLTPLRRNNNLGVPSLLGPSILSPSGRPDIHAGPLIPTSNANDAVMQALTTDTSKSPGIRPELRVPLLSCKPSTSLSNHLENRVHQGHLEINNALAPTRTPHLLIGMRNISWSAEHPKSLGVCPLQLRKVGGLISTDRRLDCIFQSIKSSLVKG